MAEETSQPTPAPSAGGKGYSKRPFWQWLLIYLVVAVVVYGLIYLLFMRDSGNGSLGY